MQKNIITKGFNLECLSDNEKIMLSELLKMIDDMDEMYVCVGLYYYIFKSTIRKTAEFFGISKSYVHQIITSNRLAELDLDVYLKCKEVRIFNRKDAPRRGGLASHK